MKSSAHIPTSRAFTLIELLVVISIIATLASISIPGIIRAKENARNLSAKSDCVQIQGAIKAYYSEYNRFPIPGNGEGPYKTDAKLMDVLMASSAGESKKLNPRGINFYDNPKIAKGPKDHGWHEPTRELHDPWGHPYLLPRPQ